jgi:hypothetical protein
MFLGVLSFSRLGRLETAKNFRFLDEISVSGQKSLSSEGQSGKLKIVTRIAKEIDGKRN